MEHLAAHAFVAMSSLSGRSMHILINDQNMTLDAPLTVNQLFEALGRSTTGTALAINQVIIPKSQWDSHLINDQDNILLFQAIAGG
jgi:sulfur carrier protein